MKKFISMVMAAAMVVSLVPATAFAADVNTATFDVVKELEVTEAEALATTPDGFVSDMAANQVAISDPQLQIKLTKVDSVIGVPDTYEFKLTFDGINVTATEFPANNAGNVVQVYRGTADTAAPVPGFDVAMATNTDKDTVTVTITEPAAGSAALTDLKAGDIISVDLDGVLKKVKVGSEATVKVSGDFGASEEMVFAAVVAKGIKVELDDDVVELAEEEIVEIEDLVIKPVAGDDFDDVLNYRYNNVAVDDGTDTHAVFTLKVSKGFEFANSTTSGEGVEIGTLSTAAVEIPVATWNVQYVDADEIKVIAPQGYIGTWANVVIDNLKIESTTAKPGDVATITVKANDLESKKVEVAKVIDYKVIMELTDADEDVPVFYSGVDAFNTGLTVEDDHEALSVTIKETFPGAWNHHKAWTLSLPEGVHVVNGVNAGVVANDVNGEWSAVQADFVAAYQKGDHETFEFAKRSWPETNPATDKAQEVEFVLTLVAEPGFEGDVVLTMEGAAVDTQEVTIAKFVSPYKVAAEQNDVIIDYRYTEIPTAITVTEAEAGLWAAGLTFEFGIDEPATLANSLIVFEDDATYEVNEESGMEVTDATGTLNFTVDEESDDEPAVVTITDMELFMQRNIPAGTYDLTLTTDLEDGAGFTGTNGYLNQALFAPTHVAGLGGAHTDDCECIINHVDDYSTIVKEAFVNVVTAGRDQDDASFTTKVVVPVGETTMYAGERAITLDVPAYINANGYTMLPVRAVATALGINNDAVQWDQATKTVIIMYGQRIITMTAGQKVVYVSGTAIPAKAAVEIVDGRAFLGLRDLATTLGISAVSYDDATKTATLN